MERTHFCTILQHLFFHGWCFYQTSRWCCTFAEESSDQPAKINIPIKSNTRVFLLHLNCTPFTFRLSNFCFSLKQFKTWLSLITFLQMLIWCFVYVFFFSSDCMYTYLDKCAVRNVEIFTEAVISNWRSWYESQLRLRTDSVALRVATHFPPFQWPFPFCCVLATQNCLATRKYKPSQKRFHLHDFLVVHHRGAVAAIRSGQLY